MNNKRGRFNGVLLREFQGQGGFLKMAKLLCKELRNLKATELTRY
jgi:hypothetical protein